jgi:hypothetical protein
LIECLSNLLRRWADHDQKLGRKSMYVRSLLMPPARLDHSTRKENNHASCPLLVHRQEPSHLACLEVVDDNGRSMAIAKGTHLWSSSAIAQPARFAGISIDFDGASSITTSTKSVLAGLGESVLNQLTQPLSTFLRLDAALLWRSTKAASPFMVASRPARSTSI